MVQNRPSWLFLERPHEKAWAHIRQVRAELRALGPGFKMPGSRVVKEIRNDVAGWHIQIVYIVG